MIDPISQLSIKELLSGGVDYIIPMYQRNFAWDDREITQLIQDVIDYLPSKKNYYMGTLVVFEREDSKPTVYETIDGQQRLTTLSLLASYIKNKTMVNVSWYQSLRIDFESREHSRRTFAAIFENKFTGDPSEVLGKHEINTAILNGYRLITKLLPHKLKENETDIEEFAAYFFDKVQIMRVKVPRGTDLNHYFEIMNSRGEQLEKHEILKSRMLEVLNGISGADDREESQNCLDVVWEACANMERYVQLGFTPKQRNAIFRQQSWTEFVVVNFDALRKTLKEDPGDDNKRSNDETIVQIIGKARGPVGDDKREDDSPERFNSVINFPNFLLQVLRVVVREDIPLDDKRLILTFETHVLNAADPIASVKGFTYALLRCKYLFDRYVIKREFIKGSDGWSLKSFKWNGGGEIKRPDRGNYVNTFGDGGSGRENRTVLMLLSAFHVSSPTLVYKHWLNAALHYLFEAKSIEASGYLSYLESVAKTFVFDRFLASGSGADYFDMIYKKDGKCQTSCHAVNAENLKARLSFDQIENNLVFNYLDYLLWLENETRESKKDSNISSYDFTFRSSVEHYYPQHPMLGYDHLEPEMLNSFGNLCLISHSKNSRLSNFMPAAKKEYYRKNPIDSVKQYIMMTFQNWDAVSISSHFDAMTTVLLSSLEHGGPDSRRPVVPVN